MPPLLFSVRARLCTSARQYPGRHAFLRSQTLFTLPDFISGPSSDLRAYNERKILPYSQKQMYDVVARVDLYSRFLPFCSGSRILSTTPFTTTDGKTDGTRLKAELTVTFMSFKEAYSSIVTCTPCTSVEAVADSSTPLFKSLTTTWRFQPASTLPPQSSRSTPLSTAASVGNALQPSTTPSGAPTDGATLVTLDLCFSFANPLHAAVSSVFFDRVTSMMISAFEERCRELYGPGKN